MKGKLLGVVAGLAALGVLMMLWEFEDERMRTASTAAQYGLSETTVRCLNDAETQDLQIESGAIDFLIYICMTDEEASAAYLGVAEGTVPLPSFMRCLRDGLRMSTREFVDWWPESEMTPENLPTIVSCRFTPTLIPGERS